MDQNDWDLTKKYDFVNDLIDLVAEWSELLRLGIIRVRIGDGVFDTLLLLIEDSLKYRIR